MSHHSNRCPWKDHDPVKFPICGFCGAITPVREETVKPEPTEDDMDGTVNAHTGDMGLSGLLEGFSKALDASAARSTRITLAEALEPLPGALVILSGAMVLSALIRRAKK